MQTIGRLNFTTTKNYCYNATDFFSNLLTRSDKEYVNVKFNVEFCRQLSMQLDVLFTRNSSSSSSLRTKRPNHETSGTYQAVHTSPRTVRPAGAIDGKKSSGSAQIVEQGFCGPVMRLSIYNVIGYRLGRWGPATQMCPRCTSPRTIITSSGTASAADWLTDWLFRHQFSIIIIIITITNSSSSSSSSVTSVSDDCQHVACRLWSYEPCNFNDVDQSYQLRHCRYDTFSCSFTLSLSLSLPLSFSLCLSSSLFVFVSSLTYTNSPRTPFISGRLSIFFNCTIQQILSFDLLSYANVWVLLARTHTELVLYQPWKISVIHLPAVYVTYVGVIV